jgi:hypothetical protein
LHSQSNSDRTNHKKRDRTLTSLTNDRNLNKNCDRNPQKTITVPKTAIAPSTKPAIALSTKNAIALSTKNAIAIPKRQTAIAFSKIKLRSQYLQKCDRTPNKPNSLNPTY